jgi:hypothetical protein
MVKGHLVAGPVFTLARSCHPACGMFCQLCAERDPGARRRDSNSRQTGNREGPWQVAPHLRGQLRSERPARALSAARAGLFALSDRFRGSPGALPLTGGAISGMAVGMIRRNERECRAFVCMNLVGRSRAPASHWRESGLGGRELYRGKRAASVAQGCADVCQGEIHGCISGRRSDLLRQSAPTGVRLRGRAGVRHIPSMLNGRGLLPMGRSLLGHRPYRI